MVHSSWIAKLKVPSRDRVSISPRSCVDFVWSAQAEIVCRFRQVIDWSSLEIGSDLRNLHRDGELWERGDRGVEEVSTEIESQGARNGALERARLCSRSAARSTGGEGRSARLVDRRARRAQEHYGRPPGRPTDKALVSVGRGRPWHGSVHHHANAFYVRIRAY